MMLITPAIAVLTMIMMMGAIRTAVSKTAIASGSMTTGSDKLRIVAVSLTIVSASWTRIVGNWRAISVGWMMITDVGRLAVVARG